MFNSQKCIVVALCSYTYRFKDHSVSCVIKKLPLELQTGETQNNLLQLLKIARLEKSKYTMCMQ